MIDFPYLAEVSQRTESKIVMLVVDGLGGLPHPDTGRSELETASLPNLDALARQSACGLTTPVAPGITPGSGPGHLALFGYDPVKYLIGRGVLEALGVGVELAPTDIAARGNLGTVGSSGVVTDRRAGRIPSEESAPLVKLLGEIEVPGVEISVYPVREHRFVMVIAGDGVGEHVGDTDPGLEGVATLEATALSADSRETARAANDFVAAAARALDGRARANTVLLRGFSRLPDWPNMAQAYRLRAAAIAGYPMYRGLAELTGMEVLPTGSTFAEELDTLEDSYSDFDFFFLHYKPADTAGEDGDFDAKVASLEELDAAVPRLLGLEPEALIVAGDHSTPAVMGAHSWHPVPLLVRSRLTKDEGVSGFSERSCGTGSLGRMPAVSVMMTALAHAGKLRKFGP